jgi:hypothetical protein
LLDRSARCAAFRFDDSLMMHRRDFSTVPFCCPDVRGSTCVRQIDKTEYESPTKSAKQRHTGGFGANSFYLSANKDKF